MPSPRRIRLAVLYGGRSAEHAVSVVSARSVMEALDPDRFEVVPIGITRDGAWLLPATSPLELAAPPGRLPEVDQAGTAVALRPDRRTGALAAGGGLGDQVDVVFPLLHGPYGEDGTVQGLFELADLPYVGSGVLASALAMDKAMAKVVFAQAGLPQAPWLVVHEPAWRADPDRIAGQVAARFTYPVFVKPARLGSSIGTAKAHDPSELPHAVEGALAHDAKILVEQGIDARELECGVLGNLEPQASVVGEVVPGHEFYDFEAKYLDEAAKLLIPAPVPGRVAEQVRQLALTAFQVLGCEGLARVDCFWDEAAERLYLNEVNTIPGFTPKSMFPLLWAASGLSYSDLVARLVELAVERHARRRA